MSVTILSDSQAAIKALLSTYTHCGSTLKAIQALNELGDSVGITIKWIKAHVSHPGNEAADEAARHAAKPENAANFIQTPSPWATYKAATQTFFMQKWSLEWNTYNHCRQTKNFFPSPDINKSKTILKLSTTNMKLLIEAFTGQNNLNYLQNIISPHEVSSLCRFCEEDNETFIHSCI